MLFLYRIFVFVLVITLIVFKSALYFQLITASFIYIIIIFSFPHNFKDPFFFTHVCLRRIFFLLIMRSFMSFGKAVDCFT